MKRYIMQLVLSMIIVALSANLLNLYYAGAWYDPIKVIEITEVVLLYACVFLGSSYFTWQALRGSK